MQQGLGPGIGQHLIRQAEDRLLPMSAGGIATEWAWVALVHRMDVGGLGHPHMVSGSVPKKTVANCQVRPHQQVPGCVRSLEEDAADSR